MPAKTITLSNFSAPQESYLTLTLCDTFFSRLKGLMFQKGLPPGGGLLFDEKRDSRLNSAIHMFFMRFPIAVFWVNSANILVSKSLAKPWHPFYIPSAPARYIIETSTSNLELWNVGDKILFDEA